VSDPEPRSTEPLVLVHHHPGRLRVRAEAFRGGGRGEPEPAPLARARESIVHNAWVTRIAADPFTGSLLIEYRPGEVEPGAVLATLAQAAGLAGVIDAETARRTRPGAAVVVADTLRTIDRALNEASGGRTNLRTLIPAALFASAAYFLVRRPEPPRWDNLMYWSYSIFRDLNDKPEGEDPRR